MKAFRRSVRTKIFAAVLLACLAPFLAAVLLQARASDANLRAAALDQASTAGALARALAQERASRLLATAEAVALTSGLPEALAAQDRAELARLSAPWLERIGTATIAYTDERGVMVLRTYAPERYGDDMAATTKGLLPALRGDPSVSTEATGLRGLAIRAFAPMRLGGRVVGIAATTQNLDQEFLTALREAAGFETFALFLDGSAVGTAPDPTTLAVLVSGRAEHTGLGLVGGQEQAVHAWPLRDPTGATSATSVSSFRSRDSPRPRRKVGAARCSLASSRSAQPGCWPGSYRACSSCRSSGSAAAPARSPPGRRRASLTYAPATSSRS